jgi:hypothetical protein
MTIDVVRGALRARGVGRLRGGLTVPSEKFFGRGYWDRTSFGASIAIMVAGSRARTDPTDS